MTTESVATTGPMATGPVTTTGPRQLIELSRRESLRLLGSAPFGRVVFTLGALPAVRPVNHLLVDDDIIIRGQLGSGLGSRLTPAGRSPGEVVVAYEVDDIDPGTRTGWSVVVTGLASQVDDPGEIERFERELRPWVDQPMNIVVRIRPELISGFRLAYA